MKNKIINFNLGDSVELILNYENKDKVLINILYNKKVIVIILIKFKDKKYFIDFTFDYMINLLRMFLSSHSDTKFKSVDFYENVFEIEVFYDSNGMEKINLLISQNKELLKNAIMEKL
ncbi:MAG: hypothetical protein ACO2OX_01455 [Candidatus Nanopusillus sp.]